MVLPDGKEIPREKGAPQGGVISPVLSNLFLHYAFDVWISNKFPNNPWARYADDGLIHCFTYKQAEILLSSLCQRLRNCGLDIHPDKTSIVYCGTDRNSIKLPREFNFLGFTFRRRECRNQSTGRIFTGFTPAISKES